MTRGGATKTRDAPERRCIVTRESGPKGGLIRFVVGPDDAIVPDLAERLPGPGIWVGADRAALEKAAGKGLFARAAKRAVRVPPDLADVVEAMLATRLIDRISMARKAGEAVTGLEKTKAALVSGKAALLVQAWDGSERGRAALTPPEGGMTDAVAVNDGGTVLINVTKLTRTFPRERAWIWQDDVWEPLEAPANCASVGTGLTPEGRVVGYLETEQGLICAAVWVNGRLCDLGTPLIAGFRPVAGNDLGHIVGNAVDEEEQPVACRWTPEFGLEYLRDLIAIPPTEHLIAANGINLRGQIIASTKHHHRLMGCLLEPEGES